jgi:molecular chaperone DnaK (HSP70)
MDRYFGFDLGDAESAVSRLDKKDQTMPEVLEVCGKKSFITAYAALKSGEILIGEKACYSADAVKRKLRFKSRFLTDPAVESDIRSFAAGVLGQLYGSGDLIKNEDSCFYVGCPAGWDKNAREVYREIFERVGFPPVRIISESRAAMVSACQSKHLQVGYDILSLPVLVVDIGSSTTDFAYICSGKEVEMQTAGEVRLGGGIMDEILLESAIRNSPGERAIRKVFSESEPWKSYCEFAARKLKEKYFTDRDYWEENPCSETVLIRYGIPTRLKLKMDRETAESLMEQKVESLGDRSFKEVFVNSLQDVRANITGALPELLFLTGGVSRMKEIRTWCQEVFPEAVVVTGAEPEFSVSRGLAWSGRIDDELKEFRSELEELKAGSIVEKIVEDRINDLYQSAVDTLVEPILTKVALPVFDRWREGEIRKLED